MKRKDFLKLMILGLKNLTYRRGKPVLGTIIITDHCNLHCKHCAVSNINNIMYSYESIVREMESFYKEGIRILFLSGGETMLWEDGKRDVRDLIKKAREIGFILINIVTNGTVTLDIPEANLVFLSLDGMKEVHNSIRGDVFDRVMENLKKATGKNITLFMAINKINYMEIEKLTRFSKEHENLNGVSFNFHTPYKRTEELCLDREEKLEAIKTIKRLINEGLPVFNLGTTLDRYISNRWKRPCRECIVSEGGKRFICGRCIAIEGLCRDCGYLFPMEFSAIFRGNIPAIIDMVRTYRKYV